MKYLRLLSLSLALGIAGCGASAPKTTLTDVDQQEDLSGSTNVLEQAKPSLMVIPSDFLLQNNGALSTQQAQGRTVYLRDYNAYLVNNATNKYLIGVIQSAFIERGFPLNDLEQTLKSINNSEIIDQADHLAKDNKTILLTTASPDMVLELDYKTQAEKFSSTLLYTLTALDSYTNKAVASIQSSVTYKYDDRIEELFSKSLESQLPKFMEQIQTAFADVVHKGREITVRIVLDKQSAISLDDEISDGITYSDWLRQYMNTNSKKGANKLQRNTASEMMFANVRIPNQNQDGTQFNAYEFANKLRRSLSTELNVKATNASQGLGDAVIIIK